MTPEELRAETPGFENCTYLNTGASGPSPRRVVEAATGFLERHEYETPAGEGMYVAADAVYEEAREAVAGLLNTDERRVALTQSTTDGINRIASAMDFEPGDVVVRTDLEHSAGILPWQRLADVHDLEIRILETREGRIDPEEYAEAVADARLACFSALTWTHGTRLPVRKLVEIAHDAGARTLVDAVQMPGQTGLDVEAWGADAVAAAGHKWLLGTWGAGFLAVSPDFLAELEPRSVGYRSVAEPDAEAYAFHEGARRLEIGTTNPAPYAALTEAIETMDRVGYGRIESRIAGLTDRLKDGLDEERLYSPREYESGLVTFADEDPEATVERLGEAGIRVRTLPGPEAIRASVHAINTEADVDALLEAL
ncbi:aminotransferase class V-fold PLP-dependent enzyme [Halalkalicoccus jeotgali]|uniref:Cysteine desulfurase n=1 Tax=Halalkalicoccus jeotgali (strain DSM 18796 / CECT 7217 / JCM 14584 / KCTC 4019 / B3) TaxID=795797 RepID=D8J2U0_HALJB|nr:aminotransferase class V-fold PLP-dependent enzyme [Halalkalicoccus jeotgali]ADJ15047.1 cysteine desulfurase [Halalkalicoccus jeotgali B3]ELY34935.1 cysteine desulfurase [Halalkalicoccus jeotgali B3]